MSLLDKQQLGFNHAHLAELRRLELRSRRKIDSDLIGNYKSAFRGSGLVFSDLREYQPGDDVKHIHWKATARTGRVYVKSYDEDRSLNIIVAVDISNSTSFGGLRSKHAKATEFAALVTMLASKGQDGIGLCLFADQIVEFLPARRSRSQVQRVLSTLLTERDLPKATNLGTCLDFLRQHQKRSSVIFVVSDFFSPPFNEELKYLSRKHDVICTLIEDDLDYRLPAAGIIQFFDAESGQRTLVDTTARSTVAALEQRQRERVRNLQQLCQSASCDYITINNNLLESLTTLMRQRTKRLR